jgi:tRNA(fMet)-specific endonuclease VapC
VKYLLDTDHISILQQESGREFAALAARLGRESRDDLAFSVVSFHDRS